MTSAVALNLKQAKKKLFLSIGNAAYPDSNAIDCVKMDVWYANDIFEQLGYEVNSSEDVSTPKELEKIINDFIQRADESKASQIILYFAGHGHVKGSRQLMRTLDGGVVDLSAIYKKSTRLSCNVITILDMCREPRDITCPVDMEVELPSLTSGSHSSYLVFPCKIGQQSFTAPNLWDTENGKQAGGLFTFHLVMQLGTQLQSRKASPDIEHVLREVKANVQQHAAQIGQAQEPIWQHETTKKCCF